MSEQETKRWALTPYGASYPARVQEAGRQLAVAAQLQQDIERRRLVAILKRISSKEAVTFLSRGQILDGDLIARFEDRWDWRGLSGNKALPWSLELLECFADRWDWTRLSCIETMPWSLELIERFVDRWDWTSLSRIETMPWSIELFERFADRWNWGDWSDFGLSGNKTMPWSIELIERFEDRWDWNGLSGIETIPWSLDLIEHFADRWDWEMLSCIESLPWSLDLIERYEDRWDWMGIRWCRNEKEEEDDEEFGRYAGRVNQLGLNGNRALPWSLDLIKRFTDRWDWEKLSRNEGLPWSLELLECFADRWDWRGSRGMDRQRDWCYSVDGGYEGANRGKVGVRRGLNVNTSLPWSLDLIERFADRWDWKWLSQNEGLPWSNELIQRFANRWDWEKLSQNQALPWFPELIDEETFERVNCSSSLMNRYYKNCFDKKDISNEASPWKIDLIEDFDEWPGLIDFNALSAREDIPWSLKVIERYEEGWDWRALSKNEALPWSLELIERFEDRWDWMRFNPLSRSESLTVPFLRASDIVEVMAYHRNITAPGNSVDLRSPKIPKPSPVMLTTLDTQVSNLFTALKAWRAEVAKERNLPAYLIFHDASLQAIAQLRPQSLSDLQGVKGIGARKIEAYGEAVLKVVRNHNGTG